MTPDPLLSNTLRPILAFRGGHIPNGMGWHVFGVMGGAAVLLVAIQVGLARKDWRYQLVGLCLAALAALMMWQLPHLDHR